MERCRCRCHVIGGSCPGLTCCDERRQLQAIATGARLMEARRREVMPYWEPDDDLDEGEEREDA